MNGEDILTGVIVGLAIVTVAVSVAVLIGTRRRARDKRVREAALRTSRPARLASFEPTCSPDRKYGLDYERRREEVRQSRVVPGMYSGTMYDPLLDVGNPVSPISPLNPMNVAMQATDSHHHIAECQPPSHDYGSSQCDTGSVSDCSSGDSGSCGGD